MIKLIESIVGLLGKVVDRVPKHSTEDVQVKAQRGMAEGLARDASSQKTAERARLEEDLEYYQELEGKDIHPFSRRNVKREIRDIRRKLKNL